MINSDWIIKKGFLTINGHLPIKIILADPDLVCTFSGNKFFDPNYGAHPWKKLFLVRIELGYLGNFQDIL